ncbi:predicted protein [Nematostella vectensis]|uniref:Thioredoxin n=1 Tax=Nematostella vectensis TaxID=45351 RepID=A7RQN2_NEMVE|nr:predicted protein [Nematostella vectensis]|eukprot:XP_001638202.1 predicted protein [Nematostella vectensis]
MLQLNTKGEFDKFLKDNEVAAIDFTATWCGPCRMIGPKFEEMAKEFKGVKCAKVDVDVNSETAESEGITAMPTFRFYKNGEMVDEVVGASESKLKELFAKHNK